MPHFCRAILLDYLPLNVAQVSAPAVTNPTGPEVRLHTPTNPPGLSFGCGQTLFHLDLIQTGPAGDRAQQGGDGGAPIVTTAQDT